MFPFCLLVFDFVEFLNVFFSEKNSEKFSKKADFVSKENHLVFFWRGIINFYYQFRLADEKKPVS